jgi:cell division protein FtsL|tara:strand:+ start:120862 stop:121128 length:267 start_codon:yes stop_codon:yes gene_type:complete
MNQVLIKSGLFSVTCLSALACVWVGYECRVLANELMQLKLAEQDLKIRWGQLLLEESALGALPRIESEAIRSAGMRAPNASDLVVVTQ